MRTESATFLRQSHKRCVRHDGAGATEGGPNAAEAFHPRGLQIREDEVVGLNPEFARRVAQVPKKLK